MKKLYIYLPCAILILVALSQIYITHTNRLLTPAKGGGFGMFSTVDKLNNRMVSVYGIIGESTVPINIDKKDAMFKKLVEDKWQIARAYPTYNHLKNLAEVLGSIKLSRDPDYLRIEVKKCVFNAKDQSIRYDIVNELTISFLRIKN